MKRQFLRVCLVWSSGPAYAEWVLFDENDRGMSTYVDPDTIRRKGDMVKVWALTDYTIIRTVAGQSLLSSKHLNEFDCAGERIRLLAFSNFSDNMGSGKLVFSNSDEQQWEPIEPGSVGQTLWKVACSKK